MWSYIYNTRQQHISVVIQVIVILNKQLTFLASCDLTVLIQMGIKSSFITNYCTELEFQITEQNLLSSGFQRIQGDKTGQMGQQKGEKQHFRHYESKKLYSLQRIKCLRRQALVLHKAIKNLQMIKNQYICNVLFSSIDRNSFNILAKQAQIKIFGEFSSSNLTNYIQKKLAQKEELQALLNSQTPIIPFTNVQIANFMHALAGIAAEVQNMCLPIQKIDPERFLIMQNEGERVKYQINFEELVFQNRNADQNGYFSFQLWNGVNQNSESLQLNEGLWKQKFQKNLVFALGMLSLHYLLLQSNDDCYNYRSKQFCLSQLENKLEKLSKILLKRLQYKEKSKQSNYNYTLGTYMDRLYTEDNQEQQQSFQLILYETIIGMLNQDKNKRLGVSQLKIRCKKIMSKVRQQYTMTKSDKTFISNITKARKTEAKIKSIEDSQSKSYSSFQRPCLKKNSSLQQNCSTTDVLRTSKARSTITNLKSKKASDRQKSTYLGKQNISENIMRRSSMKNAKGSLIKLSGYRRVQTSQHSFMEGYFQNNIAHGLGKITNKNGEIIQCVFHNNQVIEQILPLRI